MSFIGGPYYVCCPLLEVMYACRPNWISIYGEKFYPHDYVHYGFQDDDLPAFGKITDVIVLAGSTPLLELQVYRTMGINNHVASYQVRRTNETVVVLLSQLDDRRPYYAHTYLGDLCLYITMRSHTPSL